MKVKVLRKEDIDRAIANEFISLVQRKPNAVLGLATGSSPLGVYGLMVKAFEDGQVSYKDTITFNLDEYLGLDGSNDQSYRYFMDHNLFNHIDIKKENTHVPCGVGSIKEVEEKAREYDALIALNGGIDLQILGLGSDSHIAFNEPGTPLDSFTHITDIAESTIKDNARFFEKEEDVPTKAVTMGLNSIMNAKRIVLIATGKNKAEAVRDMVVGSKDPSHPAAVLRSHFNCVAYVDPEAASLLEKEVNITIIAD